MRRASRRDESQTRTQLVGGTVGQPIVHPIRPARARDEAAVAQDFQVVRHRGLQQRYAVVEVAHADFAGGLGDHGQDPQPLRVGHGAEDGGGGRGVPDPRRLRRHAVFVSHCQHDTLRIDICQYRYTSMQPERTRTRAQERGTAITRAQEAGLHLAARKSAGLHRPRARGRDCVGARTLGQR